MPPKKGLGKGLDGMIPKKIEVPQNTTPTITEVKSEQSKYDAAELLVNINEVEPNREQPRKAFDDDSLLELSESIKQFGVIQPLLVQRKKDYYEIIAGERRWRAAKQAGLKEIPIIEKKYSDQEVLEVSLIENIQREQLNPIEEAIAFKRLLDDYNLKQDELAERVSKSRTAITNSIRLLKLSTKVQEMVIEDMLDMGHARALLAVEDPNKQFELAQKIYDEKLSVREVEKMIKGLKNPKKSVKKEHKEHLFDYTDIENRLKNIMGTKVMIQAKSEKKGKIEIEYYSKEELERIFELLMSVEEEAHE